MSVDAVRILRDCRFSVVCEDIRREVTGRFIIIGVLDGIVLPEIPFKIGRFYVFNRWTSGVGEFKENVKLISPDDISVISKTEVRFVLRSPLQTSTTVSVFNGIEFKQAGYYFIEVSVDDVRKLRIPINVIAAPKEEVQQPKTEQKEQPES